MLATKVTDETFADRKDCIETCTADCPFRLKSRDYIRLIEEGKYREALNYIQEAPFPEILYRECPSKK